jgi:hypothetical protein
MEDVKKLADRVGKDLNKILDVFGQKLSTIPDEHKHLVADAQRDIAAVKKSIKEGDSQPLETLIKKYGNKH